MWPFLLNDEFMWEKVGKVYIYILSVKCISIAFQSSPCNILNFKVSS